MSPRFSANQFGPFSTVVLLFLGWWTGAPAQQLPETLPLGRILLNMPNASLEEVQKAARLQAKAGKDIKYRSGRVESKVFEGCFVPGSAFPAGKRVTLAIFSDDGCEVEVNGKKIHTQFEKPQHLPWVTETDIPAKDRAANKAKISLYELKSPEPDGKATWVEGRAYHIKVKYSNIIFQGDSDIDGCTLFAYHGGGEVFAIDPVSRGVADERFPIKSNQQPVRNCHSERKSQREERSRRVGLDRTECSGGAHYIPSGRGVLKRKI